MRSLTSVVSFVLCVVQTSHLHAKRRTRPSAGPGLRRVPPRMRSLVNFRDAGKLSGLPLGRIYRSDDPRTRPHGTCELLRRLGIRSIVKLNHHQQQIDMNYLPRWRRGPCRLPELAVSIPHERTRGARGLNIYKLTTRFRSPEHLRVQRYMKRQLKHMFRKLSQVKPGQLPLLVHCSLGRDRAGVVVAMLQLLGGASPAAVERDYLKSGSNVGSVSLYGLRRLLRRMQPIDRFLRFKLGLDGPTVLRIRRLVRGPSQDRRVKGDPKDPGSGTAGATARPSGTP